MSLSSRCAVVLLIALSAETAQAQGLGWQWSELTWNANPHRVYTRAGVVHLTPHTGGGGAIVELTGPPSSKSKLWKKRLQVRYSDAGVIGKANGRVFVVLYSTRASRAMAFAFDARTGASLWRKAVRGLGPVSHSKYSNAIQLGRDNNNLVIYGRETAGRYVEVRDGASGRLLGNARVPVALTRLTWNWHGNPSKRGWYKRPVRLAAPNGGAFLFINDTRNKAELVRRLNRRGKRMWQRKLPGQAFCGNAALARHRRTLYVAQFCSISTGTTLHAINIRSGALRWSKHLIGIGPVGHSKYFNDVQLEIRRGMVVVYGNEASGKYVEARDLSSGRLLMNRRFP